METIVKLYPGEAINVVYISFLADHVQLFVQIPALLLRVLVHMT